MHGGPIKTWQRVKSGMHDEERQRLPRKETRFLLLIVISVSYQMKMDFWLSFPRGMVFVQWGGVRWEIKPHVACRKKRLFSMCSGAPQCMSQSETGFSLCSSLASKHACHMLGWGWGWGGEGAGEAKRPGGHGWQPWGVLWCGATQPGSCLETGPAAPSTCQTQTGALPPRQYVLWPLCSHSFNRKQERRKKYPQLPLDLNLKAEPTLPHGWGYRSPKSQLPFSLLTLNSPNWHCRSSHTMVSAFPSN